VGARVREGFAVSKHATPKFDVEGFKLSKLTELEVIKQYKIKISNWFAALGSFSDNEDINRTWENITENIKTSAKENLGLLELKYHKPV
jgi:flagellar biosynthesis/type III secretory pathway chaperone